MISQELNANRRLFLGVTPKQFICKLSTAGTDVGPKTRPKDIIMDGCCTADGQFALADLSVVNSGWTPRRSA